MAPREDHLWWANRRGPRSLGRSHRVRDSSWRLVPTRATGRKRRHSITLPTQRNRGDRLFRKDSEKHRRIRCHFDPDLGTASRRDAADLQSLHQTKSPSPCCSTSTPAWTSSTTRAQTNRARRHKFGPTRFNPPKLLRPIQLGLASRVVGPRESPDPQCCWPES